MATILFIDDDPVILELYEALLESKGYKVLTAPDGPTGIILPHKHAVDAVMPTLSASGKIPPLSVAPSIAITLSHRCRIIRGNPPQSTASPSPRRIRDLDPTECRPGRYAGVFSVGVRRALCEGLHRHMQWLAPLHNLCKPDSTQRSDSGLGSRRCGHGTCRCGVNERNRDLCAPG